MFGFIVGTVCLIGLIKVARGGGWQRRWNGGLGHGRHSWFLRRLFQRLETTPGQERVIFTAVEGVQRAAFALKDEALRSRVDLAKALRSEQFDSASVREVFSRHEASVQNVEKTLLEGMQSVHEALSPEQRAELADLIEFGPRHGYGHGRGGCGYRGHSHRGEATFNA